MVKVTTELKSVSTVLTTIVAVFFTQMQRLSSRAMFSKNGAMKMTVEATREIGRRK